MSTPDNLSTPDLPEFTISDQHAIATSKLILNGWLEHSQFFDWSNEYRYLLLDILPSDHQGKQLYTSRPIVRWEREKLYSQDDQTHPSVLEAELLVNFDQITLKETTGVTKLTDLSVRIYLKWEFDRNENQLFIGRITLNSPKRNLLWEEERLIDESYHKHKLSDEAINRADLQNGLIKSIFEAYSNLKGKRLIPQHQLTKLTNRIKTAKRDKSALPLLTIEINSVYEAIELYNVLVPIRYHIAQMDRYKPFLDNPLWHPQQSNNGTLFQSYDSRLDTRYLMHCSEAYQAIYNFWSRIGELIAKYVYVSLGKIDFIKIVPELAKAVELEGIIPVQWFTDFIENHYSSFLKDRSKVVHHLSITTQALTGHLNNAHNREEIEQQQSWKESRLEYVVAHFHRAVEGVNNLSELLRRLPPNISSDEKETVYRQYQTASD